MSQSRGARVLVPRPNAEGRPVVPKPSTLRPPAKAAVGPRPVRARAPARPSAPPLPVHVPSREPTQRLGSLSAADAERLLERASPTPGSVPDRATPPAPASVPAAVFAAGTGAASGSDAPVPRQSGFVRARGRQPSLPPPPPTPAGGLERALSQARSFAVPVEQTGPRPRVRERHAPAAAAPVPAPPARHDDDGMAETLALVEPPLLRWWRRLVGWLFGR